MDFKRKKQLQKRLLFGYFKAFSLVELMISLIIISLIAAAFVPVVTKKLSKNSIIAGGSSSEIIEQCTDKFGALCKLCTKNYCVQCALSCQEGQYVNTKTCDECKSCATFDTNCKSCTQNGCTKCKSDYYLKDNVCTKCDTGKFCDGINMSSDCPVGYYCDSTGKHACTTFHQNCLKCDKNGCTSCESYYRNQNGTCVMCQPKTGAQTVCGSCSKSLDWCDWCDNRTYLENGGCFWCGTSIANCERCSSKTKCSTCKQGYYLTSEGTCATCNVENCTLCQGGESASSAKCKTCFAGYYLNSNGQCISCSSKFSNCAVCEEGKCTACNQGYIVKNGNCEKADSTRFNCSDSNFMKIGNLCFTRRNMGDSVMLAIPDGIKVVKAGGEYCPSGSMKCCWTQGTTTSSCNSTNVTYSGCNRATCNWEAANAICANFSVEDDKGQWRLPQNAELTAYAANSFDGLGDNGLMFCNGKRNSINCNSSPCYGAEYNACYPSVWGANTDGNLNAIQARPGEGTWLSWWAHKTQAHSVRCVKDMSN